MLQIEKFKKDLCETISRYFNEVLTIVCLLVVNVIKLENPEFRNTPQKMEMDARYMPHFKVKLMNLYIINAKYKLFGFFFNYLTIVTSCFSCSIS